MPKHEILHQRRYNRPPSFLDSSLRLDGIIDILGTVQDEPRYASQIYIISKIRFKASRLKYMKYCCERKFLEKYSVPRTGYEPKFEKNKTDKKYYVYYKITDKGRQFLELVH